MPLAINIFGNIEIGVNPGIVFTSLMMISPVSRTKKSTRARPSQASAAKEKGETMRRLGI